MTERISIEQHDVNECRQFPEENLARKTKDNSRAIEIGNGSRHADKGHHARVFVAEFVIKPLEKWPAAVEKDDRREGKLNIAIPAKVESFAESQPLLNHGSKDEYGDGQDERNPETAAKICNHLGMVRLVVMAVVLRMRIIVVLRVIWHKIPCFQRSRHNETPTQSSIIRDQR